jgi:protein tyrosine/serine phosphatase
VWRRTKRIAQACRQGIMDNTPNWLRRAVGPVVTRLDMLFIDHGFFRLFYLNKHRLGPNAWRSAQPAPHHIRVLARQGVRTIINLRGERECGSYWLEQAACERHGIKLVNFQVRSRQAPTAEQIRAAKELFDSIEYPMLLHCKSGADRVGLMSVLYRHLKEGVPLEEAKEQLSLRYGHFRQADTGVLDRVFECYLEHNKRQPIAFLEWVDKVYDADELKRSFRSSGWARRLVDQVLRRE